jgi:hypothetical protein
LLIAHDFTLIAGASMKLYRASASLLHTQSSAGSDEADETKPIMLCADGSTDIAEDNKGSSSTSHDFHQRARYGFNCQSSELGPGEVISCEAAHSLKLRPGEAFT